MTLRMVAVLRISSKLLEMAGEDTGSPVSIYVRTIPARIWRLRRSWSAAGLIAALCLGGRLYCKDAVKQRQRLTPFVGRQAIWPRWEPSRSALLRVVGLGGPPH